MQHRGTKFRFKRITDAPTSIAWIEWNQQVNNNNNKKTFADKVGVCHRSQYANQSAVKPPAGMPESSPTIQINSWVD